jgi:hypothetical protein
MPRSPNGRPGRRGVSTKRPAEVDVRDDRSGAMARPILLQPHCSHGRRCDGYWGSHLGHEGHRAMTNAARLIVVDDEPDLRGIAAEYLGKQRATPPRGERASNR